MLRVLTVAAGVALVYGQQSPAVVDLAVTSDTEFAFVQKTRSFAIPRPDLVKQGRAKAEAVHQIVFAIKQSNMDLLEARLNDVANPRSANYGKYLNREEIRKLTVNKAATDAVTEFAAANGITIVQSTKAGEYITCEAPVSTWEKVLKTEFYQYLQKDSKKTLIRTEEYSLPATVREHISAAFKTTFIPDRSHFKNMKPNTKREVQEDIKKQVSKRKLLRSNNDGKKGTAATTNGYVYPQFLFDYYSINTQVGNSDATTAVFESLNQSYSPSDLQSFQNYYGLPEIPVATLIPNNKQHAYDNACLWADGADCTEANLDVQYMSAVAPNNPMTYYYWDDETNEDLWLSWVTAMADSDNPPLVNSISYSSYEESYDVSYANSFDTEAIKLGNMGVTLLSASGDDGVAGYVVRDYGASYCAYYPQFPASSPYVTAVGATMGPEDDNTEVPCTSNGGGVITTGGGISGLYDTPSWQTSFVNGYFSAVTAAGKKLKSGYQTGGRGYPDVSLVGYNYLVNLAGEYYGVSGTSASTPTFASFVAIVNAARMNNGLGPLGWINPSLYTYYESFIQVDQTTGENNCCAEGSPTTCCQQGFFAVTGWDPVTGLGSVNFADFYDTMTTIIGTVTDDAVTDDAAGANDDNSAGANDDDAASTLVTSMAPFATVISAAIAIFAASLM